MKKLFAFLAVLFVSIGTKASITVFNNESSKINGETCYAIYSWSSPGELALFLNGNYTGDVYYNNSPVSSYATAQWFTELKAATAIKIGGSQDAPYEVVNDADLAALELLTGVKYLDMDLATPASDADFSKIKIGSSILELVTLPSGVTKEQVIAANNVLKTKGAKAVVGMTGENKTESVTTYWYTVPGSSEEQEYTGTVSEGQTTVTVNNMSVWKDLDNAEGYPKYTISIDNVNFEVSEEYVSEKTFTEWGNTWTEKVANLSEYPVKLTEDTGNNRMSYWDANNTTWVYINLPNDNIYTKEDINGTTVYFINVNIAPDTKEFRNVTCNYLYTYKDLQGVTHTINGYGNETTTPSPQADADGKIELKYSGELTLYPKTEYVTGYVVDGMTACVNNPGYLDDVRNYLFTKDQLTGYKGSKNITILGNINNDDLAEIKYDNFKEATFINMSGATLTSTSDITTMHACLTAAILLPQIATANGGVRTISLSELGTLQDAQTYATNVSNAYTSGVTTYIGGYQCLAYYDLNSNGELDVNKLNVYSYSDVVANLAPAVVQEQTAIKFLPVYDTTGDFKDYAGNQSTVAFNPFLNALGDLPALSIDLSEINQNMMPHFTAGTYTATVNNTTEELTTQGLSPYTHYLTVYGNSGNSYNEKYDFTLESGSNFTYPSTVWVVSAFKSNNEFVLDENGQKIEREDKPGSYKRTGHASIAHYAGKYLVASEPTNIVYVRTSDHLASAFNFMTDEAKVAKRQILVGNLTSTDMSAINATKQEAGDVYDGKIHSEKIDLISAVATNAVLQSLDNDYVKYLALPDDANDAINATSADNCSFSGKCAGLLCVGAYNTTTNTLTTWSSAPGNVYAVTSMIRPQKTNRGTGLICASLNNVVMSGNLNWDDISTNNDNGKNNGLENATILTADLTNAYFPNNEDMVFSTAWSSSSAVTKLVLPIYEEQTLIPENCCYGFTSLRTICIPSNYEEIGKNAFYGAGLTCIYTTPYPGDDFREDEDVYNHGFQTITLSSNVQKIHTGAFKTVTMPVSDDVHDTHCWKDVYVLASEAPICERDAFSSAAYHGDNDFEGKAHPINREIYYTGEPYYIAFLHFPNSCYESVNGKDPEALNYTDITRKYTLVDETGAYDGKGHLMTWPLFSESGRAYNQAVTGVTWDAWPEERQLDLETAGNMYGEVDMLGDPGAEQGATLFYYGDDKVIPDPTDETATWYSRYVMGVNSGKTYNWRDYMGWHQFVLAGGYHYADFTPDAPVDYEVQGWYTLCLPFDLTAKELVNLIGAPDNGKVSNYDELPGTEIAGIGKLPTVYTLKSVTRQYPDVILNFSQDLMGLIKSGKDITFTDIEEPEEGEDYAADSYNYTQNYSYSGKNNSTDLDKRIFIKGGYSYLVRPILPKSNTPLIAEDQTLGQFMLANSTLGQEDLGNIVQLQDGEEGYIVAPINNQKVIARTSGNEKVTIDMEEEDSKYYYYFQGTYTKSIVPRYSFFLKKESGKPEYWNKIKISHKKSETSTDWEPFTAVIGGKCNNQAVEYLTLNKDGNEGLKGMTTYFVSINNQNDDFIHVNQNNVKYSFTFEDEDGFNEAVSIDKIDGKIVNSLEDGQVYSVTGQYVSKSINGLSKGLYIINGKKVVIK